MKSNAALMSMLLLAFASTPGWALSRSATAIAAGRVMGLPSEKLTNFELVFVRETAPCAVLRTHTLADGSFRLSSIRAGDYRVAVSNLPNGYGIKTMTAGVVDLLSNSVTVVASSQSQLLIEIARIEDIRHEKPPVVHVGSVLRSPCLIHQVKPAYPSQAKAAHIVGNVIMEVRTNRNGYVEEVTVVQGHPLLIQSAIGAVRQWRYVPVVFGGETVPVVTTVVVPFGSM